MKSIPKNIKAETIVAKLFAAMSARKQALVDGDFVVSNEITKKNGILDNFNPEGNSYRQFVAAVEGTKSIIDFNMLVNIIGKHKPNGSSDVDYIQCKTIEKILKLTKAIAYKDFRMLDTHTRAITVNAMVNAGIISAKGAFASLVKVEFDALSGASSEILRARHEYTPGTGSTQLSSTRELFRTMGLCDSVKGAKDAPITFTESAKSALIEHFENIAALSGASAEEIENMSDELNDE